MIVAKRDLLPGLLPEGSVGAELGVAKGAYSRVLLDSGRFSEMWCIDRWSDHHGLGEYTGCLRALEGAKVMRATFAEAATAFPDEFFDFVYVDGYAHTGQDSGRTLLDWYPKVKPGGIFAGHDYHESDWPLTFQEVNRVAESFGLALNVTAEPRWPSWWARRAA